MKTAAEYELSCQLNAGAIDSQSGIIRGATVAVAGVEATGKFVCLDKSGNITNDEKLAVTKVPIYTDAKTLTTLMGAAQDAGGTLKIRSDHSETLQDRAGYADGFRIVDNRVTADLHLHKSYRDREIVLETAMSTPKLIGLSIDMIPFFDIENGKAMMRVAELLAVDIVDAGAITHDGLFLKREVDKLPTVNNPQKLNLMATENEKKEPTTGECMAKIDGLSKLFSDFMASQPKKEEQAALSSDLKAVSTQLSAISTEVLNMKKTNAALGLSAAGKGDNGGDKEIEEALKLKADKDKEDAAKKSLTFEQKVDAEFAASAGKLKRSEVSRAIMKREPALYQKHLVNSGVLRISA